MRNFFRQIFVKYKAQTRFSKNFAGFSLIELLVGMTIGGIVLATVMTSYVAMVKTSIRLDLARQMQKETNFAVIRMADKIRNFPIKSCEKTKLTLNGRNRGEIVFQFLENQHKATMDNQPLFSENILLEEGKFKCFGVENPAKLQPRVQIYLKIRSEKDDELSNWIRTTISSRIYE